MMKPFTSLDWYLGYLHSMLTGMKMPMWDDIYFTEDIVYNGAQISNLGELIHYKNYYDRFKDLATSGWSWINLYAVGLHNNNLILHIEIPNSKPEMTDFTSVNISGPMKFVIDNGFEIGEV